LLEELYGCYATKEVWGLAFGEPMHGSSVEDCNYAFKHIGRRMMKKALTKEQYGSRKGHKATDLATNKI
jgi:hypothetical protein